MYCQDQPFSCKTFYLTSRIFLTLKWQHMIKELLVVDLLMKSFSSGCLCDKTNICEFHNDDGTRFSNLVSECWLKSTFSYYLWNGKLDFSYFGIWLDYFLLGHFSHGFMIRWKSSEKFFSIGLANSSEASKLKRKVIFLEQQIWKCQVWKISTNSLFSLVFSSLICKDYLLLQKAEFQIEFGLKGY